MQIGSIAFALILFFKLLRKHGKKHSSNLHKTLGIKPGSAKINQPFVQSVYKKSDLVACIKVISATKQQEAYVIDAQLIEVYKG